VRTPRPRNVIGENCEQFSPGSPRSSTCSQCVAPAPRCFVSIASCHIRQTPTPSPRVGTTLGPWPLQFGPIQCGSLTACPTQLVAQPAFAQTRFIHALPTPL
jgi:hypothetical protein